MNTLASSDFLLFLGRFHPLVLHLPIGLFAGVAALEALGLVMHKLPRTRRFFTEMEHKAEGALNLPLPGLEGATRLTLAMAALSAVLAAALGLMLASSGQFSGDDFTWHKWLGIALAAVGCVAFALRPAHVALASVGRGLAYALALGACLGLLGGAGHYGGSLTHGPKYLNEHTPSWIPAWMPVVGRPPEAPAATAGAGSVYEAQIKPLLAARCAECHNESKTNGNLRLDDLALALQAGASGRKGLVPGDAMASECIRRVSLPVGHPEFMPPSGKQPLSGDEVLLLARWVQAGAKASDEAASAVPKEKKVVDAAAVERLAEAGAVVYPVTQGSDDLVVDFSRAKGMDDAKLALVAPVADFVAELNLNRTAVTDQGVGALPALPRLRSLKVAGTKVSGAGVARLLTFPKVVYLNAANTTLDDAALPALAAAKNLREAVLYGTPVTEEGLAKLLAARKADRDFRVQHELLPLPDAGLPQLRFTSVSSEEIGGAKYAGANAFDGSDDTIWHTQYRDSHASPPYILTFEHTRRTPLAGLVLTPRQDSPNGTPKDFAVQSSADGKKWEPLMEGVLWAAYDKAAKEVVFPQPSKAKFFRLVVKSEVGGQRYGSLAEVRVLEKK